MGGTGTGGETGKVCEHLEPKEIYIENNGKKKWESDEIPWQICKIKRAMGLKNIGCAFVSYTLDHGLEYVQYNESHARACPLYTEKAEAAERVRLLMLGTQGTTPGPFFG